MTPAAMLALRGSQNLGCQLTPNQKCNVDARCWNNTGVTEDGPGCFGACKNENDCCGVGVDGSLACTVPIELTEAVSGCVACVQGGWCPANGCYPSNVMILCADNVDCKCEGASQYNNFTPGC
jgi:hypothetical protein